jgi:hypothetical protein
MTGEILVALLAERVMGWGVGPDRFLVGNRGWMPRWRFQPAKKLADALRLLEAAAPQEYRIWGEKGSTHVHVRIAGTTGEASESSKPLAITYAVARAVGLPVPDNATLAFGTNDGMSHLSRRRPNGK